jgi:16S rRNA G966 N2-methylase RsmD
MKLQRNYTKKAAVCKTAFLLYSLGTVEPSLFKLIFIPGLKDVVIRELALHKAVRSIETTNDSIYIESADYDDLLSLRSVIAVFLITQGKQLTPRFISNHKSILGTLIEKVLGRSSVFKTFKISCAGPRSKEVQSIKRFVADTYRLTETSEADLEIYIGKTGGMWECGVRLTPRPLSLREYKKENLKGALNPTIAYAMDSLCDLETAKSYLNIFSGSATLLIEAGLSNPKLKLVGFDSDGKRNAAAIQNIKAAGLLQSIKLHTADIFSKPSLGTFDCITADLPFGMQINEIEDLPKLYETFLKYCETVLVEYGTLVAYTAQTELFAKKLSASRFRIETVLDLTLPTTVSPRKYLHPKIFVCSFK